MLAKIVYHLKRLFKNTKVLPKPKAELKNLERQIKFYDKWLQSQEENPDSEFAAKYQQVQKEQKNRRKQAKTLKKVCR